MASELRLLGVEKGKLGSSKNSNGLLRKVIALWWLHGVRILNTYCYHEQYYK